MVFKCKWISGERQPLLQSSSTYQAVDEEVSSPVEEYSPPLNKFSTTDLCWILGGLWSAVFLGALDGWSGSIIASFSR